MTRQIAVKLSDDIVVAIDGLVEARWFASRSDAVRAGLRRVIDDAQRHTVDRAYAEGYARRPESDEELAEAKRLSIESIESEPWEKWW